MDELWNKYYQEKYNTLPHVTPVEKRETHDTSVLYAREQIKGSKK